MKSCAGTIAIRHSQASAGSPIVLNVRQNPDRQSRRDRLARPARLQGARHRHRGRAFDRRRRRDACPPCRRKRLHRPAAARNSYLNIRRCSPPARSPAPSGAPGLRLPVRERRFAEISKEHNIAFIGPRRRQIRLMGDKIEAKRTARRWASRWCRAPTADRFRRGGPKRSPRDRLPGPDQGGGGRRRPRHEGRAIGRRIGHGTRDRARRGAGRVRRRSVYIEKYLGAAPHRDPGARRRRGRPSISASATARCSAVIRRSGRKSPSPALNAGAAQAHRRDRRQGHARDRISRRRHRRIPVRRRRASISSR